MRWGNLEFAYFLLDHLPRDSFAGSCERFILFCRPSRPRIRSSLLLQRSSTATTAQRGFP
jgi:hypothetical protein